VSKSQAELDIDYYERLKSDKNNFSNWFQELARYVIPYKAEVTTRRAPGTRLPRDIYDTTAIQALNIFAAGLSGYLTNPASPWFSLRLQDRELMDNKEVKVWLKQAERKSYDIFSSSNFYNQIHETYIELGAFGTAALYYEDDPRKLIRFDTIFIGDVFIDENAREEVDKIFRELRLTPAQAIELFGDQAGSKAIKCFEEGKTTERIKYLHCVYPRDFRDLTKKDAKNKKFASYYYELEEKILVKEGGYDEFPFLVPRYTKLSWNRYGHSPAMQALPDIKMINQMMLTTIKAAQVATFPPLSIPNEGYILPFRSGPGSKNFRLTSDPNDMAKPIVAGVNLPTGLEMMNQTRGQINSAFFVDMFLSLINQKNMTATEVQERVAEKMLILGPALGRMMHELLDPSVVAVFLTAMEQGAIPEPPDIIKDKDLVIEYVSPLARAQRAAEAGGITNLLAVIGDMSQYTQSVLDKIDEDEVVDILADVYGTPPTVIRSDDEVEQIRAQRQQAAVDFQEQQVAAGQAETAEKMSKADLNTQKARTQ